MPVTKHIGGQSYCRYRTLNRIEEANAAYSSSNDPGYLEADFDHPWLRNCLANIAHELRTPLIGILGSVDLLEHASLHPAQLASVHTIKECGDQLLNTLDDLLEAYAVGSGTVELNLSPTNLPKLLQSAAAEIGPHLQAKKLLLELEIPAHLPVTVRLDQSKLSRVLSNLLNNAVKFTHRGGLRCSADIKTDDSAHNWLLISIADTGIGINSNQQEHIFKPFIQLDSSNKREYSGNGLGLYICKKLIGLMEGHIQVESQPDVGTTFNLKIPVEIMADKHGANQPSRSDDALHDSSFINPFKPVTILLVEDNEPNQKLIAQMLINYGFDVSTAANGLECLSILQQKNFNLVLMDMQMPVMDGYEATGMIRNNPAWSDLPILAITANSLSGDRERCLACGCTSYLSKPFKTEQLIAEIKQLLSHKTFKGKHSEIQSQQLIEELMPEFMEMLAQNLDELGDAISTKNLVDIKSISHNLKGTAGMYGFMKVSDLAAHMETAARDKNYGKMNSLYQQIIALVQNIKSQQNSVGFS